MLNLVLVTITCLLCQALKAVKNIESYLKKRDESLPKRATSPWTRDYRPETDTSPELFESESSYYQSLIGILRWVVELNRFDIAMEVSALASMMAMPRKGHLQQVFHIFAFLKSKHNASIVFDPSESDIDESQFAREDWTVAAYGECMEDVPSKAPKSRCKNLSRPPFEVNSESILLSSTSLTLDISFFMRHIFTVNVLYSLRSETLSRDSFIIFCAQRCTCIRNEWSLFEQVKHINFRFVFTPF